jgi:amino acid adenylation domain-containing protein
MKTFVLADSEIVTIQGAIDSMASARGESVFLISPESGRSLTFSALRHEARAVSALLRRAGLEPGDKAAFLMDNGLFTVQLFLGTMYGGMVSVPLNVRAGAAQLTYTLEHCDAKVVFVEDQYLPLAEQALNGLSRKVQVIRADVDAFASECAPPSDSSPPAAPSPEDIALLIYTSGSVGQPKAAIHSHRTVLAHGRNSRTSHELVAADRSLLVLPIYHINAECVTLMPTLLSGGSVVVPHHFSVSQFWDWLAEYRCTWSAVVPTIISQLLDWKDPKASERDAAFRGIRFIRSSSAPLSPSLQREFMEKFPIRLIQAMGSSEAGNIFSNPQAPGENKIGTPGPAWGFETRIVSPDGVDVAQGEAGEVLLRGAAVTRGYYKDAEQTAAVFDKDAWLHTGDLAYQDEDGYFFVVGRSKELIIKGGMNIAPRQIDEVLESHPSVLEAAVVGVPDRHLGEDLVAFAVLRSGAEIEEKAMLAFCENRLGHFKTPTRIHFVKDLPKGPSGKVQRLRLLDDAVNLAAMAPSYTNGQLTEAMQAGALAETIAHAWAEVLGEPKIATDANFFSLGGHSLAAIQCLSRMRDHLPFALSLSDFFEHPTVAQQVELIKKRLEAAAEGHAAEKGSSPSASMGPGPAANGARPQAIPAQDRTWTNPLSSGQKRIWFFEELAPEVPLYNESESVRLAGELKKDALEQALNVVIARHEMLRTTIRTGEDELKAVVHSTWPLHIKQVDLSGLEPAARQAEIDRLLIEEPRIRYHLDQEPGIRATLVQVSQRDHVFILMMHHLVCDWASEGVLWRELSSAYHSIVRGEQPELPSLPIQYGDYAAWQQQRVAESGFAEDLDFWADNLRGAPELLELPADRPRPSAQTYRGKRQRYRLNAALTQAVRIRSREEKTSLFTFFAAALETLLHRYTSSEDIVIGLPIAERENELQSVIGFLLHTQALRIRLSGAMTFRELLGAVQKGVIALYSHREVPFEQVVSRIHQGRSLSHSPIFQVLMNWRDQDQHLSYIGLEGLEVESLLSETRTSKFDLTLQLTDFGDEIWLEAEYSTELFDDDRIARMFGHYQTILEAAAANADQRLSDLPLLTQNERRQLIEWNKTEAEFPPGKCIHQLFEEQAARTPDAIALTFGDHEVSYQELNQRSNQLARHLRENLGVKANELVAICTERSIEMLTGILGILKAGAAYVPLDPGYPQERLAFMLEDTQARVLLTQGSLVSKIAAHDRRLVCLDNDHAEIERQSAENLESGIGPESRAYVIFTSGSTGTPKGVAITHYNVARLFQSTEQWFRFGPKDVWTLFHSYAFDFSVWEMWGALLHGGRLVVVPYIVSRSPEAFWNLLSHERVTVLNQTPSAFRQLIEFEGSLAEPAKLALRLVIFGGEALDMSSLAPWYERHGEDAPQLVNMYGITETTVHVTYRPLKRIDVVRGSLIGKPIPDLEIHIADENLRPVPIGIPGEICVGGAGLAIGYLNRADLTVERFVPNPVSEKTGARLYRSGDLARFLPNGDIEYLGRADQQVKIRGYRIELGEIEAALRQHAAVRQCVVSPKQEDSGHRQLVAYIVPEERRGRPNYSELRDFLKQKLPDYMVPAVFMTIDELPLTSNGKIDRRSLPTPEADRTSTAAAYIAPRTPTEEAVAEIWRSVLRLKQIGINESFFDLGGDSLLAIRLVIKIHNALNYRFSLPEFFQNPTICGMAAVLLGPKQAETAQELALLNRGSSPGALFFLNAEAGLCRVAKLLKAGPASYATAVPLSRATFTAAALNHPENLPSAAEMASKHVALIRAQVGSVPCYLAGHSFNGTLAFEAAHQLQGQGIPVELILLFDSWARKPSYRERLTALSVDRTRRALSYRLNRLRSLINLRYFSKREAVSAVLSGVHSSSSEAANDSVAELSESVLRWIYGWVYPRLRNNYQYRQLNSRGVLFSCQRESHGPLSGMGWEGLFARGLEVVDVPGDHFSLLADRYASELAMRIDDIVERLADGELPPSLSRRESRGAAYAAGRMAL